MSRSANSIEWGALLYEIKRLYRPISHRIAIHDLEWVPPLKTSLLVAITVLGLMVYSGLLLLWETPQAVWFAAVLPFYIAKRTWKERNPLLKNPPSRFMAAVGFPQDLWYRASLVMGILRSFFLGMVLALGVLYVYENTRIHPTYDREFFLSLAALPMLCVFFFLIFLTWEQNRALYPLKNREVFLNRFQRKPRSPGFRLQGLGGLFPLWTLVFLMAYHQSESRVILNLFLVIWGLTALPMLWSALLRSRAYVFPLLLTACLFVYVLLLHLIENMGGLGLWPKILELIKKITPIVAFSILVGLFLMLAWIRISSPGRSPCDIEVRKGES